MDAPLLEVKVSDGWATGVRFLPDGSLLTTGVDPLVRKWSAEGKPVATFAGHEKSVDAMTVFAGGSRLLSGSVDGTARVWDVGSGEPLGVLTGHRKTVSSVAVTPDGRLAITGSYDRTIRLWDLEAMSEVRTLKGHPNNVVGLAVSPDGGLLASGGVRSGVMLWRLPSGEVQGTIEDAHLLAAIPVAFTPHGLLSVGADDTFALWSLPDLAEVRRAPIGGTGTHAAAISPDGSLLAVTFDRGARLFALPSAEMVDEVGFGVKGVYGVSFSDDGSLLAVATSDSFVRVWRVR